MGNNSLQLLIPSVSFLDSCFPWRVCLSKGASALPATHRDRPVTRRTCKNLWWYQVLVGNRRLLPKSSIFWVGHVFSFISTRGWRVKCYNVSMFFSLSLYLCCRFCRFCRSMHMVHTVSLVNFLSIRGAYRHYRPVQKSWPVTFPIAFTWIKEIPETKKHASLTGATSIWKKANVQWRSWPWWPWHLHGFFQNLFSSQDDEDDLQEDPTLIRGWGPTGHRGQWDTTSVLVHEIW